jgi:hypothetical protein
MARDPLYPPVEGLIPHPKHLRNLIPRDLPPLHQVMDHSLPFVIDISLDRYTVSVPKRPVQVAGVNLEAPGNLFDLFSCHPVFQSVLNRSTHGTLRDHGAAQVVADERA